MAEIKTVVTVLGKDRPGIIAAVAKTCADNGATILDIRQSVLEEIFSMTMKVTLLQDNFNEVQEALAVDAENLGVQIQIQRQEVFDFMYNL